MTGTDAGQPGETRPMTAVSTERKSGRGGLAVGCLLLGALVGWYVSVVSVRWKADRTSVEQLISFSSALNAAYTAMLMTPEAGFDEMVVKLREIHGDEHLPVIVFLRVDRHVWPVDGAQPDNRSVALGYGVAHSALGGPAVVYVLMRDGYVAAMMPDEAVAEMIHRRKFRPVRTGSLR